MMMGQNNMIDLRRLDIRVFQSCAKQIPIIFIAGIDSGHTDLRLLPKSSLSRLVLTG